MLGTLPEQAVVIEDAISGVQTGLTGGFGLVIGVARGDDAEVLRQNGADVVVRDLAALSLV
jgi:beta-phosphoglucomutase-like phosphatase (HAD superfamily)